MFGATCNQCGSTELESDPNQGATVCTKCGHVIEENLIVSELQFEEGSHGAANLIGRMVSNDANYKSLAAGTIGNNLSVNSRESREITLENAKRRIKSIGQQLRLNNHCVTTAFNFYKMALSRRLTYGRRQNNVYAACLYMTCRIEGTSHMLLDLSDVTQVNIFELGKTYLKLSNALCINIPPIDPCIYIVRFSNRLHKLIGTDASKVRDIELTALRLVQRMKRDWIHTGRRPSGLCGSALLVACRLNGIHCNIRDIIKIVQVCETTIRKRLAEFGDTQTGRLTLDEFMTVDLEGEDDPPCFKEARKRQKLMLQELESGDQASKFESEISKFQKMIDDKLESLRSEKQKRGRSALEGNDTDDEVITEDNAVDKIIEHETADVLTRVLNDKDTSTTVLEKLKEFRPTAKSLGLGTNRSSGLEVILAETTPSQPDDGELDLTGIDDEEIDSYLLNDKERLSREDLWTKVNSEYLQEQDKAAEEEAEHPRVKRKQTKRKRAPCVATTANEAVETMLHEKRISSKINYQVLSAIMKSDLTESIMNDIDID
uniref:B-related factor 1 n=1 Tax=Aceria tosichella TaxID=561515 RepID=A0A6G1S663_9ACAR